MDRLIRRDLPLEAGRTVRFRFTIDYEVPLDDDVLDYVDESGQALAPATLAEIEETLSDRHGSSESLWKELHGNYDRVLVEHEATLGDAADEGVRFETRWERESRLRGETWTSREWLEGVPPAAPTRRIGQCIALLTTSKTTEAYCQRALGHGGEHTPDADEAARLDAPSSAGASEHPTAEEVMRRDG